jgi:hypothetical protein
LISAERACLEKGATTARVKNPGNAPQALPGFFICPKQHIATRICLALKPFGFGAKNRFPTNILKYSTMFIP